MSLLLTFVLDKLLHPRLEHRAKLGGKVIRDLTRFRMCISLPLAAGATVVLFALAPSQYPAKATLVMQRQ